MVIGDNDDADNAADVGQFQCVDKSTDRLVISDNVPRLYVLDDVSWCCTATVDNE